MKRLAVVAIGLTVVLSGCGITPSTTTEYVRLPDGRDVICIWKRHGYAGGLSCDFINPARKVEGQ